jgi:hypothetical protein
MHEPRGLSAFRTKVAIREQLRINLELKLLNDWEKSMVRKIGFVRLILASAFVTGAAASQAITFSNVIIQSPPLSNGSSFTTIGNSISFFTPNAIVGDVTAPLRSGTLNMQFDASNFAGPFMTADQVVVNLGSVCLGSGTILFLETVIELDAFGNEIGGSIGTISHLFNASSPLIWSGDINFSHPVASFRAKKSFSLFAPDTDGVDLAAVAIVNQNITVPEPATMGALAIGAVTLLARRRRK